MRKTFFMAALGLSAVCVTAFADELTMPQPAEATPAEAVSAPQAALTVPARGITMKAVVKQFGEPKVRHKPAGGGRKHQPPITRWDYADFSVFFEHSRVVDTVVHGQPVEVHHQEELKPAE